MYDQNIVKKINQITDKKMQTPQENENHKLLWPSIPIGYDRKKKSNRIVQWILET